MGQLLFQTLEEALNWGGKPGWISQFSLSIILSNHDFASTWSQWRLAQRESDQKKQHKKFEKFQFWSRFFCYIEVILKDLTGQPNFRQLVKVRYVLTYIFSIVSPNRNFPAKKGKDYLEVAFFLFQATKSLFFCDVSIRSSISKYILSSL